MVHLRVRTRSIGLMSRGRRPLLVVVRCNLESKKSVNKELVEDSRPETRCLILISSLVSSMSEHLECQITLSVTCLCLTNNFCMSHDDTLVNYSLRFDLSLYSCSR